MAAGLAVPAVTAVVAVTAVAAVTAVILAPSRAVAAPDRSAAEGRARPGPADASARGVDGARENHADEPQAALAREVVDVVSAMQALVAADPPGRRQLAVFPGLYERCAIAVAALHAAGRVEVALPPAVAAIDPGLGRSEVRAGARVVLAAPRHIDEMCDQAARRFRLITVGYAVEDAERAIRQLSSLRGVAHYKALEQVHRRCERVHARALAAGIPDTATVVYRGGEVSLDAVGARACDALAAALAGARAELADRYRATLARYGDALAGDRLAVVTDDLLFGARVFTTGKRELDGPEALARASVWYELLRDCDSFGNPFWLVRRHEFRGDSRVSMTRFRGEGAEPPDAVFE